MVLKALFSLALALSYSVAFGQDIFSYDFKDRAIPFDSLYYVEDLDCKLDSIVVRYLDLLGNSSCANPLTKRDLQKNQDLRWLFIDTATAGPLSDLCGLKNLEGLQFYNVYDSFPDCICELDHLKHLSIPLSSNASLPKFNEYKSLVSLALFTDSERLLNNANRLNWDNSNLKFLYLGNEFPNRASLEFIGSLDSLIYLGLYPKKPIAELPTYLRNLDNLEAFESDFDLLNAKNINLIGDFEKLRVLHTSLEYPLPNDFKEVDFTPLSNLKHISIYIITPEFGVKVPNEAAESLKEILAKQLPNVSIEVLIIPFY